MSTYTSEPGTLLAGRYRLVDQTSVGAGWAFWKATDEPLARFVTVLTFASGFPRITEAITAARAASRLGDPRFSQVFDVEDAGELAYVVLEWVAGASLFDMLADGPLDTPAAGSLLCDAALTGYWPGSPDPAGPGDGEAPADVQGPDPQSRPALPAAPEADGIPLTPRQVSAAVPASIDALTCQALFQRPSRHGPALSTSAMLAEALANAAPPDPMPMPTAATASLRAQPDRGYRPNGPTNPFPAADPVTRPRSGAPRRRPDRSSTRAVIVSSVVVVVLVAAGVVGWALSHRGSTGAAAPPTNSPSSSSAPSAAASGVITPVRANS